MPLPFPLVGALAVPSHPCAANDNPPAANLPHVSQPALLRDALRHFAAHGRGAAELARSNAAQAFFAGNRRDYLRWLAICRTLDRQMVGGKRTAPRPLR